MVEEESNGGEYSEYGCGRWKTKVQNWMKNKETGKSMVWGQRQKTATDVLVSPICSLGTGHFIFNELVIEKASNIFGLNLSP